MVWYLIVISIVIVIIIKLAIPYIKKNYIDDVVICRICNGKYNKKLKGCPRCNMDRI